MWFETLLLCQYKCLLWPVDELTPSLLWNYTVCPWQYSLLWDLLINVSMVYLFPYLTFNPICNFTFKVFLFVWSRLYLASFLFSPKAFFNIYYSTSLLLMNSFSSPTHHFSFCVLENVSILSSFFLKDIFAGYRIIGWHFFPLLNYLLFVLDSSFYQDSKDVSPLPYGFIISDE